jgi:hypothetical protein
LLLFNRRAVANAALIAAVDIGALRPIASAGVRNTDILISSSVDVTATGTGTDALLSGGVDVNVGVTVPFVDGASVVVVAAVAAAAS